MSIKTELFRAGQGILAREPVKCEKYGEYGMIGQWANTTQLRPGLFVEAVFPRRWTVDVRRISSMALGIIDPELGFSWLGLTRGPGSGDLYENDLGRWYLERFEQYSAQPRLVPLGISGLDQVLKDYEALGSVA